MSLLRCSSLRRRCCAVAAAYRVAARPTRATARSSAGGVDARLAAGKGFSLPDASTRLTYEGLISDGSFTQAGLALAASESEWNLLNIDFANILELGIGYI